MRYIILDLDGTIAQSGERSIFYAVEPKNYAAAEAAVEQDALIENTKKLIEFFSHSHKIIVLTARSEVCRGGCIAWLNKNKIPFEDIYLRPKGDMTKDYVIKEKLLQDIMEKYGPPDFALEDQPAVIEMFNRNGVFVFGIHK